MEYFYYSPSSSISSLSALTDASYAEPGIRYPYSDLESLPIQAYSFSYDSALKAFYPAQAPPAFAIPPVTQQQQQPPPPPSPTIPIISPTPRLAYSVFDQVLGFDADDLLDARDDRQSPPAPHHRVDPVPAIAAPPSSGQPPALARRKRPLYDDEPPLPLDDSPRKRPRVSIPAAPSYSVYTHQHQQYSHTAAALPREAPRRARHTALTYSAAPPQSYHYAAPHRPAPHRYAQHIAPRQPAR